MTCYPSISSRLAFGEGGKLRKINELFRFLVELEQDPSSTEEDKKTIDSILERTG
ncbi:hypothetical protein L0O93_12450 [Bacteroides finegoldii]|uniref:hypothetical protein n=1 Tax=Bacteroides xylanisolvens TaxID=371601 RepID=UPI0032190885|nr:hypothetical protein [Bacteroides finegoldii]MCS2960249.1 hypothetical protein [Bacteroides thetaiotaomicron]